jgi:hypothetical protein
MAGNQGTGPWCHCRYEKILLVVGGWRHLESAPWSVAPVAPQMITFRNNLVTGCDESVGSG